MQNFVKNLLPVLVFPVCVLGCGQPEGYEASSQGVKYFHAEELFTGTATAMPTANPGTFSVLSVDDRCGIDVSSVYFRGKLIKKADPTNFRIIEFPYSTDGRHIFCGTVRIDSPDIGSFVVLRGSRVGVSTYEGGLGTEPMFGDLPTCLLYTSPSPRDQRGSRMPSSA